MNRSYLFLLLLACVVWGTSCKDVGESWAPPRVWPEEATVDGIALGESYRSVIARLGEPTWRDSIIGYPYPYRAIGYYQGPHAGLEIYHQQGSDPSEPAHFFFLRSTYTGKTIAGIGIGSSRAEVRRVYGTPKQSSIAGIPFEWDEYSFRRCTMRFNYSSFADNHIYLISIQTYFLPE